MEISVEFDDQEILRKLKGINDARLRTWISYAEKQESYEFADYIRNYWLSGQALNCTPESDTWKSLLPWTRKKDKRVFIRPGVGIRGTLNYLARWDQKSGHEFMAPAWKRFNASDRVAKAVLDNIDKMMTEVMEK